MRGMILISRPSPWREGIGAYFAAHGLNVRFGDSGKDAEALLATTRADILVVDVDDLGLIATLRARRHRLGIIALTDPDGAIGAVEALNAGADIHSPRNLNPKLLLATVGSLARRLA